MVSSKVIYCPKCGNTGIDINNNVCSCQKNVKSYFDAVSCLAVPEQYRGVQFNKALVPKDISDAYADYLQSVYETIRSGKWFLHNLIISSPISHSKTILAYSCIEILFREGYPIVPLFDVLELKRILTDMDLCRKPLYEIDNPESIITAPVLFAKIPRISDYEIANTVALLIDRRVRRNNSTIFLYDGEWSELISRDKRGILAGLIGDGKYASLEVKSWGLIGTSSKPNLVFDENIG